MLTAKKTFTSGSIEKISLLKNKKNSTQKDVHQYLYKKDDELNGENFDDVDNGGIIEYGNDFIKCKIIQTEIQNKSKFHALSKKTKKARKNCFR